MDSKEKYDTWHSGRNRHGRPLLSDEIFLPPDGANNIGNSEAFSKTGNKNVRSAVDGEPSSDLHGTTSLTNKMQGLRGQSSQKDYWLEYKSKYGALGLMDDKSASYHKDATSYTATSANRNTTSYHSTLANGTPGYSTSDNNKKPGSRGSEGVVQVFSRIEGDSVLTNGNSYEQRASKTVPRPNDSHLVGNQKQDLNRSMDSAMLSRVLVRAASEDGSDRHGDQLPPYLRTGQTKVMGQGRRSMSDLGLMKVRPRLNHTPRTAALLQNPAISRHLANMMGLNQNDPKVIDNFDETFKYVHGLPGTYLNSNENLNSSLSFEPGAFSRLQSSMRKTAHVIQQGETPVSSISVSSISKHPATGISDLEGEKDAMDCCTCQHAQHKMVAINKTTTATGASNQFQNREEMGRNKGPKSCDRCGKSCDKDTSQSAATKKSHDLDEDRGMFSHSDPLRAPAKNLSRSVNDLSRLGAKTAAFHLPSFKEFKQIRRVQRQTNIDLLPSCIEESSLETSEGLEPSNTTAKDEVSTASADKTVVPQVRDDSPESTPDASVPTSFSMPNLKAAPSRESLKEENSQGESWESCSGASDSEDSVQGDGYVPSAMTGNQSTPDDSREGTLISDITDTTQTPSQSTPGNSRKGTMKSGATDTTQTPSQYLEVTPEGATTPSQDASVRWDPASLPPRPRSAKPSPRVLRPTPSISPKPSRKAYCDKKKRFCDKAFDEDKDSSFSSSSGATDSNSNSKSGSSTSDSKPRIVVSGENKIKSSSGVNNRARTRTKEHLLDPAATYDLTASDLVTSDLDMESFDEDYFQEMAGLKDNEGSTVFRSTSDVSDIKAEENRKKMTKEKRNKPYKSDPFSEGQRSKGQRALTSMAPRVETVKEEVMSFLQAQNSPTGVSGGSSSSDSHSSSLQSIDSHDYEDISFSDGLPCTDCNKLVPPPDLDSDPATMETDQFISLCEAPPMCKKCTARRVERKEAIQEIADTEVSYGKDLKVIKKEFYEPMRSSSLLTADQLQTIFINLDELIAINDHFSDQLLDSLELANEQGDEDYITVNIGKLFLDASSMLLAFETYCVNQSAAPLLLDQLSAEKELLRIFLEVSQNDNPALRKMDLKAFLMLPVQRVMKYPLLLSRLLKVTTTFHEDRERIKTAKAKVDEILGHINSNTQDSMTSRIRRRFSTATRRSSSLENSSLEIHKAALELLGWSRNEATFIMTGRLAFTQPTDHTWTAKRGKNLKFTNVQALLVTRGRGPIEDVYSKRLMFASREKHVKQAVLVLVKEKLGKYVPLREALSLDQCVVSMDTTFPEVVEVYETGGDMYLFKGEDKQDTEHWWKQLRYQAKDHGKWRRRRNGLANIMIQTQHHDS